MIELTFRQLKERPPTWKDAAVIRPSSPFSSTYTATKTLLQKELGLIAATDAFLQVELSDPIRGVRNDGQLRANARAVHPGVILTIETEGRGTLVFPCDKFAGRGSREGWQENLRAVALGLEALRKVERYGIADLGQQFAGYRELGTGTAGSGERYDRAGLCRFLATAAGWDEGTEPDPEDRVAIQAAFADAARRHHPDHGGTTQMMASLNMARDELLGSDR